MAKSPTIYVLSDISTSGYIDSSTVPINMISMITNDNYDNHVHIGNTINMITSLG